MKKNANTSIKKNQHTHYVEAKTAHQPETEMEMANEFFNEDYVRPLDSQGILADQLIEKLKNDSHH